MKLKPSRDVFSLIREHVNLTPYNTFGIACKARYFSEPFDLQELQDVLQFVFSGKIPLLVSGGGSNMLYCGPVEGMVLRPLLKGIEILGQTEETVSVRVWAGEDWDGLVAYCVARGWWGLENLSLIPGHVGASPVQNIGAYGVEVKDRIEKVEALALPELSPCTFSREACGFGYRNSIFKQGGKGQYLITSVIFKLSRKPVFNLDYGNLARRVETLGGPSPGNIRQAVIAIRREKLPDPKVMGNAGSFFKNPILPLSEAIVLKEKFPDMPYFELSGGRVKLSAAWLIEQAGWKGKALGRVGVHAGQPLVLVNLGGATGTEVVKGAETIRQDIFRRYGLMLEPEVQMAGNISLSAR